MTAPTNAVTPRNTSGPSLAKLVSHIPADRRWRRQADALIVIGRQLELMAQEQGRTAHVSLGTLRFSLFRMHQTRMSQLAPFCQSITVYGEADIPAPDIPGITFVPVAAGAAMSQEWFLVIDSPGFWATLVAQASPDRADGAGRRYLFDGVLTADERVVSRASLLLSLARGQSISASTTRDPFVNHAHWAHVAYALATHTEVQRLDLLGSLIDLPELYTLLSLPSRNLSMIAPETIEVLRRHCGSVGEVIYRIEGAMLAPIAWSGPQRPPEQPVNSGIMGQALLQGHLALVPSNPADPEYALLNQANSIAAIPLIVRGSPWGVLLIGQEEYDLEKAPTTTAALGVAALLEQMIEADPTGATQPAMSGFNVGHTPTHHVSAPSHMADPTPSFVPPSAHPAPPAYTPPAYTPPAVHAPPPAGQPRLTAPAQAANTQGSTFGLPAWMRNQNRQGQPTGQVPATPTSPSSEGPNLRSWPVLRQRLFQALVAYDQQAAEQVWSETCAIYTPEQICNELLTPTQIEIGNGWHRGEVSVAAEHFSSRFVQSKLLNLFNASMDHPGGPKAIVACAQGELHEIGAIMISLFLRWGGFHVIYLGQNVPNSTIEEMVYHLNPQVLALSASTVAAAHGLIAASEVIAQMSSSRPLFIFGGLAFREREDLQTRVREGFYYQGDVRQIARVIVEKIWSV